LEFVIAGIVGLVVGAVIGFGVAAARSKEPAEEDLRGALRALVSELQAGRVPGESGPSEVGAVQAALADWAPRSSERSEAIRMALGRIHAYLEANVDRPLRRGLSGERPLKTAISQARAAVRDLEFFLADPAGEPRRENLNDLVRTVTRDFTNEWDVSLRLAATPAPIHVSAYADALMDALYLVLHNAAQFGSGSSVSVEMSQEEGWGRVIVRDDGPGFTAEALSRAYDPFYTTTEGALGLGLSHARKAVEFQGGRIHLRNRESGGAEVEIAVPIAR
jgi:signal transduction histidine kinase